HGDGVGVRAGPQGALRGGHLLLPDVPRSGAARGRGPDRPDHRRRPLGLHLRRCQQPRRVPRACRGRDPVGRRLLRGRAAGDVVVGYLVVAAVAEEARYVPDRIPVLVTGIGKTAAAVAVTRDLSAQEDLSDLVVLNIGTAGALHGGMTGLHAPVAVINHDISAEAIRSLGHDPKERIQLRIGEGPVLATGDVFV